MVALCWSMVAENVRDLPESGNCSSAAVTNRGTAALCLLLVRCSHRGNSIKHELHRVGREQDPKQPG
jgi:hypothetical protein